LFNSNWWAQKSWFTPTPYKSYSLPLVIVALTDGVPELKKIKSLRGLIEKIKTLGIELKIVDNFREVNRNFSFNIYIYIYIYIHGTRQVWDGYYYHQGQVAACEEF
jgi:hypothetical protein